MTLPDFFTKILGKRLLNRSNPFSAKIVFACQQVPEQTRLARAAVEDFMNRFPERIAAPPRIHEATDGNVIELTVWCYHTRDVKRLNRIFEMIALRYQLR